MEDAYLFVRAGSLAMEGYLSETDHWTDQTKVSRELAESNETGLAGILAILRPVFLD